MIRKRLFELYDSEYKRFISPLLPTIPEEKIIGVRMPDIRRLSKEILREGGSRAFLNDLPHRYYEENNLHAFLIADLPFSECIAELYAFLPYVDNWGTCDSLRPTSFKHNRSALLPYIYDWIKNGGVFTKRFAIEMLMMHYLDEDFRQEFFDMVANTESDDYYLDMMKAWYFATALCKRFEETVCFIENGRLIPFVKGKAISKAIDSKLISKERKDQLRLLRDKTKKRM